MRRLVGDFFLWEKRERELSKGEIFLLGILEIRLEESVFQIFQDSEE